MSIKWEYCTLEEYAEGDAVHARAVLHDRANGGTILQEFSHAGEGLFSLGNAGWELVGVTRETRPAVIVDANLVISLHYLKRMKVTEAWQHCLMISADGDGPPSSATIIYLDSLDASGNPRYEELGSRYAGFKKLGAEGWRLMQVIEMTGDTGVYDGPSGPSTHHYYARPAPEKG